MLRDVRLDGLKVVIDCANGAAHRTAPEVLWELGADVILIGIARRTVRTSTLIAGRRSPGLPPKPLLPDGADVGICLDGDADRVVVIDEAGKVADGDQLMALLATAWSQRANRLKGGALVVTVMSNLGLERHLAEQGLRLERMAVGDRYVVERMRQGGFNLGGEQSGHIVMSDYATTGDGLMAGLHFLAEMVLAEKKASDLLHQFETVPQLLKNVRFTAGSDPA